MKLKSLTINGFKSFADKTEIDFQPGITGIVGPNGSGKSNIIESLRWVLGEQSVKNLRGSKMPDVIFAGSETRAPLNRAEVEVEFDNSDQFLVGQPESLRITRRIYRSGDSEFLLNGKKVRLKDIVNLLMDTGLGKESFSIISQGRVESIFNSRPEDRRVLIEETAGILKYKKEKEHAEKELKETNDHLKRVVDILTELKRQREPLKEQASVARDYLEQKKQFDYYKLNELVLKIRVGQQQKVKFNEQLVQAQKHLDHYRQASQQQKLQVTQIHEKQQDIEQRLDYLQTQLVMLTQQRERLAGKKDISAQQHQFQIEKVKSLTTQIEETKRSLATFKNQIEEAHQLVTDLMSKKQKLKENIKELEDSQALTSSELEKIIKDLNSQINQQVQQKMQAENEKQLLLRKEKEHQAELDKVNQQVMKLYRDYSGSEELFEKNNQKVKKLQKQLKSAEQQADLSHQKRMQLNARLDQQRQNWYQANEVMQKAQTRLEALKSVESSYSRYYQGVRGVLQHRKQLLGIVGSVAEVINVDQQYSKAIETTLGSQLQNIIVKDEITAKKGIQFLTKKRLGRATFLPQTVIHSRFIDKRLLNAAKSIQGFIAVASDLVRYDPDNQNVIRFLLGTTLIAQDVDAATQIAKVINHRYKIVTLQGEVINPGGSMTGGANRNQREGLLQQKQERNVLVDQLQKMQSQLSALEKKSQKIKSRLAAIITQGQDTSKEVECFRHKLQEAWKQKNESQSRFDEFQRQKKSLETHLNDLNAFDPSERKMELEKQIKGFDSDICKLKLKLGRYKSTAKDAQQEQQKNVATLSEYKQQLVLVTERLSNTQLRLNDVQSQQERMSQSLVQQQAKLQRIQNQQSLNDLHGDELAKKQTIIEHQHTEYTKKVATLKQQRDQLHEQMASAEDQLQRVNELQQASNDEQRKISLQLGRVISKLEQNLQELADKYQITFEKAAKEVTENDLSDVQRHLKLLKRGIDELGKVNLGAIDEFERVNERFKFLNTQQNDLNLACSTLIDSMNEMDEEVKTRFKKTFDKVSMAFSTLFPQIFGGGKAYLTLTNPDDLLHTGIEITAQPPGKKAQRLSLLSGGERSLTAITLLFALLKVRPVPFAVLDEAEAALDDANVARYSQYLKNFDSETQFIVITHRKGTMMQADVLYGVTMQESGVSKMVSVSLADVV